MSVAVIVVTAIPHFARMHIVFNSFTTRRIGF